MTYGRLQGLPFVVCDKLMKSFLSTLCQDCDHSPLPLIGQCQNSQKHFRHYRFACSIPIESLGQLAPLVQRDPCGLCLRKVDEIQTEVHVRPTQL